MIDVFISYKQEEREAVQIIASSLHDLKLSIWFDTKLRSGGSFDEEIAAALNEAKAVLVCWTPAAIESEWVRGEATQGMQSSRLAACFLQPTNLIPPFNLTHAENLCAWAGQKGDLAWIKLLERIGELVGRPGLSTYHHVMRSGASLAELKEWANANGADPLVDSVWARASAIEGEGATARVEREKTEARIAGELRKAHAEKSRRLARERGLRDPRAERMRLLALTGSVIAIAVFSLGAIIYFVDAQARDRSLRDEANSVPEVREFLAENNWHPISERAHEKLARLDVDAWTDASTNGSIEALEAYLGGARPPPEGAFIAQAEAQLATAERTKRVQEILTRLLIYPGPLDGALNDETKVAIETFRYRWNLPVSSEIDDRLLARLDEALGIWIHPRLDDLRAARPEPPTEAEYIRIAAKYNVEASVFMAVAEVESGRLGGFAEDGRPIIMFEPHIFSRRTNRIYDQSHPNISYPTWDASQYPRTQEGRWAQLSEAYALNSEAALASASYGRSQVMGFYYLQFGFETAGEFARFISQSELNQMELILRFAQANDIVDELQRHDWEGFARRYNGSGQVERYGRLLREAHARVEAELSERYSTRRPAQPEASGATDASSQRQSSPPPQ